MDRCAEPTTQLGIDEFILDYLIYMAIKDLLEESKAIISSNTDNSIRLDKKVELPLKMVDSFLAVFRSLHPNHHGSVELRLRLRLLKFTSLFVSNFKPSMATPSILELQRMREQHYQQARASPMYKNLPQNLNVGRLTGPPTPSKLKTIANDEQLSNVIQAPDESKKKLDSPSLLDSLPEFMALCAAVHVILQGTQVTDVWMNLAADYMAQAVIEQFLVYGEQGTCVLRQAFSYGFDSESVAEEASDEFLINALFFDDDKQVEGWDMIREEHIRALIPPPETSRQDHLEALAANELPLKDFEWHLIEFLDDLFNSQPKPLLAQVESRKVVW